MQIERYQLEGKYKKLYHCITAILFENDPMGIDPTKDDEYEPEVSTILPRLSEVETAEDVHRIVCEEFEHWFGGTSYNAERCEDAAREIWVAWSTYKNGLS